MKFTQEDLLNKLGIEIDKPFLVEYRNGITTQIKLDKYLRIFYKLPNSKWETQDNTLLDILGCEITPLPKYTLTETEKHIVLAIDEKWIELYRLGGDMVVLYDKYGNNRVMDMLESAFYPFHCTRLFRLTNCEKSLRR
jgi:hypothetical protein